jgi:hypothetical protein
VAAKPRSGGDEAGPRPLAATPGQVDGADADAETPTIGTIRLVTMSSSRRIFGDSWMSPAVRSKGLAARGRAQQGQRLKGRGRPRGIIPINEG